MREAQRIGDRIGCPMAERPEDRTRITRKLGAFATSMLQDARAGRPLELDALVGAVRERSVRSSANRPRRSTRCTG
jgi:2-dehydropantoate 2-reductase